MEENIGGFDEEIEDTGGWIRDVFNELIARCKKSSSSKNLYFDASRLYLEICDYRRKLDLILDKNYVSVLFKWDFLVVKDIV